MQRTIENTNEYRLDSIGNGAAYLFISKRTGDEIFIQYGDDATQFREDYDALNKAYFTEGTVYFNMSWNECLADLFGRYFPS
jgi:hypothetical protein